MSTTDEDSDDGSPNPGLDSFGQPIRLAGLSFIRPTKPVDDEPSTTSQNSTPKSGDNEVPSHELIADLAKDLFVTSAPEDSDPLCRDTVPLQASH